MPTRDDLQRMLVYLQRIEEKLLDMEDQLEVMASAKTSACCTGEAGKEFDPCDSTDNEDCDSSEPHVARRQPAGFTDGKKLKNQAAPKKTGKTSTASKGTKVPAKKGKLRR